VFADFDFRRSHSLGFPRIVFVLFGVVVIDFYIVLLVLSFVFTID